MMSVAYDGFPSQLEIIGGGKRKRKNITTQQA
jgi:hypothetical protein